MAWPRHTRSAVTKFGRYGSCGAFVTERGAPFTRSGFAKMVERSGHAAGFNFPVHMHMLRHACGYHYANRGEDTRALQLWLGHRSIQHTVRYSELSAERFKDW